MNEVKAMELVAEVLEQKLKFDSTEVDDFKALVVPLKNIADTNFSRLMDSLPGDGDATVVALRATLWTLHGMWHSKNPRWRSVRNRFRVGIVKETNTCGNTSVSMGFAARYFKENPNRQSVGFINCGSGGNKYQQYLKLSDGTVAVGYEGKPKNGSSPGLFTVAGFVPDKGALDDNANNTLLCKEIEDYYAKAEATHGVDPGELFAFVTGKFRNHWEKGDDGVKAQMNERMNNYFGSSCRNVHPAEETFVLKQDTEGERESDGTARMYDQLRAHELINPGVVPIVVDGIGQGSVQWLARQPGGDGAHRFNFTPGMANPDKLALMPWAAIPAIEQQLDDLSLWADQCAEPTIALKSGCLLFVGFPAGKETLNIMLEKAPVDAVSNILMGFLDTTVDTLNSLTSYVRNANLKVAVQSAEVAKQAEVVKTCDVKPMDVTPAEVAKAKEVVTDDPVMIHADAPRS